MAAPSSRRRRRIVVLLVVGAAVWWWRRRAAAAPRSAPPVPPPPGALYQRPDPVTEVLPVVEPAEPAPATGGFGPTSPAAAEPHPLFTPAPAPRRPSPRRRVPVEEPPEPGRTIKGNASSMLFHTPASPYYERTKADAWFRDADEARAAGFTEWVPRRRGAG
jgi:hypothetical protein